MNTTNNSTGNGYSHKGTTASVNIASKSQNGTQKNPQDLYRRNF